MSLMISEVYCALRSIVPEAEAREHAIVLSDADASHAAIAGAFRAIGVPGELAERAAKAVISFRSRIRDR